MLKIIPLSEGEFTVGHDKQIIPFNPKTDKLLERPIGSLHVEIQPFLIDTGKECILFDTGLGLKYDSGNLMIHDNLIKNGYRCEDVRKVFHSHLHKDHCGGMTYKSENGIVNSTFPNAQYYLFRKEVEYALKTGEPSYDTQKIEEILTLQQVIWLDNEIDDIDSNVRYIHTGGHCPFHIVFIVTTENDKAFYGGDEAPQLKQMKLKYIAKYDYDGKKALQIRDKFATQGKKENWSFLFYHDVANAIAKL